jgi:hypothetical protein
MILNRLHVRVIRRSPASAALRDAATRALASAGLFRGLHGGEAGDGASSEHGREPAGNLVLVILLPARVLLPASTKDARLLRPSLLAVTPVPPPGTPTSRCPSPSPPCDKSPSPTGTLLFLGCPSPSQGASSPVRPLSALQGVAPSAHYSPHRRAHKRRSLPPPPSLSLHMLVIWFFLTLDRSVSSSLVCRIDL